MTKRRVDEWGLLLTLQGFLPFSAQVSGKVREEKAGRT
jgi:hypothetical protein